MRKTSIDDMIGALETLKNFCTERDCKTCPLGIDSGKEFTNCAVVHLNIKTMIPAKIKKYTQMRKNLK